MNFKEEMEARQELYSNLKIAQKQIENNQKCFTKDEVFQKMSDKINQK